MSHRNTQKPKRREPKKSRVAVWLGVVWVGIATHAVAAVVPAVVIGPDLDPQTIQLHSISAGLLNYFGADRQLKTRPVDSVLQLRRPADQTTQKAPSIPHGIVRLTDGQRIVGTWRGGGEQGQTVLWEHPLLGRLVIGLDRITHIVVSGPSPTAEVGLTESGGRGPGEQTDKIELVNGDVLLGYVHAVQQGQVVFQADEQAVPVRLDIARILSLSIINPPIARRDGGYLLWLTDGSRIAADALGVSEGKVTARVTLRGMGGTGEIGGGEGSITMPLDVLDRVDFPLAQDRLRSIAQLPMRVVQEAQAFGVRFAPRVEEQSLYLHAPTVVEFQLPKGSSRFGATARLEYGSDRRWADVRVIIRNNERPIADVYLSAHRPGASINVAVEQGLLTIELDQAANGPVQDRVEIVGPGVYLGQTGETFGKDP